MRGAGAAAPGAARPPAGDAGSGGVRTLSLHRGARGCWPSTAATRRPAGGSGPTANPAENPDRLFLVQHEGQALDAIERFGDAPCVLPFMLVP